MVAALLTACADSPLTRIGETCASDGQCTSGRCDELVCKPSDPLDEGGACTNGYQCASEVCILEGAVGVCGGGVRPLGQGCTTDAQCVSGACRAGFCVAASHEGGLPDGASDGGVADGGDAAPIDQDGGNVDLGAPVNHLWSVGFGGTSLDYGESIAVGENGSTVVAGRFNGTMNLGGGDLVNKGGYTYFVANFDAAGNHVWSKALELITNISVNDVAVADDGSVYGVGSFSNNIQLDGNDLNSAGASDAFIVNWSASGEFIGAQTFGDVESQSFTAIALDTTGRPVVAGAFAGSVDLGGGPLTSVGSSDVVLAKLDGAGNHVWSRIFGSTSGNSDRPTSVDVDASGNIALSGYLSGSYDFGQGLHTPDGQCDLFVARMDSQGQTLWGRAFGSPFADFNIYAATDSSGRVAIAGELTGPVDFGGGALVPRQDSDDVFVALYGPDGTHLWSKNYGSIGSDVAEDVAMDDQGNIFVTGWFSGTISMGGDFLTSAGYGDVFVASYDVQGNYRWALAYGSPQPEGGAGISVAAGRIAVTGNFDETVSFGGQPLKTQGGDDVFVLLLEE